MQKKNLDWSVNVYVFSLICRLSETQQELEEFQEGSRDLETELEAQLEQAEAKNKELAAANQQLKQECERLQVSRWNMF